MKLIIPVVCIFLLLSSCKNNTKKSDDSSVQKKSLTDEKTISTSVSTKVDMSNMVFFNGGTAQIGSDKGMPNEQPAFETEVAPFYLDKNLVSVADFRKFIEATNHKTEAEKYGDSGVFMFDKGEWTLLKGANWEYPLGETKPKAADNHPVTQVSWNDAQAYASWTGKRLPTEYEYEFAAKNGKNSIYPWGSTALKNGKHMTNVWQGVDVKQADVKDGYLLTSPIGHYPPSEAGLSDIVGNVWQWTQDVYRSYPGNKNPEPEDSKVRTMRGGSFMFDQALEKSFTTTFRSKISADTSLFNTGFRCAK